jgi:hypothetical protein
LNECNDQPTSLQGGNFLPDQVENRGPYDIQRVLHPFQGDILDKRVLEYTVEIFSIEPIAVPPGPTLTSVCRNTLAEIQIFDLCVKSAPHL